MVEIIPAILPKSLADLEAHVHKLNGITRDVQIDIVDGQFAPNLTWPFADRQNLTDAEALLSKYAVEVDLMVNESRTTSESWVAFGVSRIVIHIESPDDKGALLALTDQRSSSLMVGIALNIETSLERLKSLEGLFDFVQLMGIARPGFQGEQQDLRTGERVAALRAMYPHVTISVDGGVTKDNAPALAAAGATRLVVGSTLFEAKDVSAAYEELKGIANG